MTCLALVLFLHHLMDTPCSINQEQKTYFDVYKRLNLTSHKMILVLCHLVLLWICYPLFPETLSWYAIVFAHPVSVGYLVSTILVPWVSLINSLFDGFFRYFWICGFMLASFYIMVRGLERLQGVIGKTGRRNRPTFNPFFTYIITVTHPHSQKLV